MTCKPLQTIVVHNLVSYIKRIILHVLTSSYLYSAAVTSKNTQPTSGKWTRIRAIEIQFAKMTRRIEQALISNNVDVAELIKQLCTISVVKNKKVPLFDEDVFERIKSIDALWRKLKNFWSIFDYQLLECVIEISECEEAQRIFEEFLSRIDPLVIEDVDLVLYCGEENQEGSLKPVLRVKVNTEKCTVNIKKQVEEIISKTYNLDKYALHFQGIKEGCIELLYYISKQLKSHLLEFKISEVAMAEFHSNKIICLHIDELKLEIPSRTTDVMVSS